MFIELDSAATNEMPALVPVVEVDGQIIPELRVLTVEDTVGIQPGKARLRYMPAREVSSPMTLNRYPHDAIKYGARVRIYQGDRIFFQGALMRREDSGQADAIVWTALDDRHLLTLIPIRGCLIYDPTGSPEVKFIPRYQPRTNPKGFWNCTGASIGGTTYPVFAHTAYLGRTYESPTEAYEKLARGKLTAWTPRLFLEYLQLLQVISPYSNYDGIYSEHWRSLYGSTRLGWELQEILDLHGIDPAAGATTDPLDRKMPDISFQGQALGLALQRTLAVTGTHDLRLRYEQTAMGGKSYLEISPTGYTAAYAGQGTEIRIKRGGAADDVNTAYDFQLHEDASKLRESVLVEGDVVKVEGRMSSTGDLRLVSGWSADEETAFKRVINGGDGAGNYAKIPPTQGAAYDANTWVDADGTNGRPYALKRSAEAANLARQLYPAVYKAFYLDTSKLSDLLDGQGDEFKNDSQKYPRLNVKGARPILATQLQYIQRDMSSGEDVANLLREQYPVRITVNTGGQGSDVLYSVGLRVTGDGRIWIDNLSESVNNQYSCLYAGDYESNPMGMSIKPFRINAATVMDHRVFGYKSISYAATELADSFYAGSSYAAMDGLPMQYIDSPEAYREHHQVDSYPAGNDSYYGGADGSVLSTAPLTRIVPPGSERKHAEYAAERKLALTRHVYRASSWKLVGIRPEYRAGLWISKITPIGGDSSDTPYLVEAPLLRVTWDFSAQTTICGGLAGQLV
ncbi:MAG: hypothetical protein ACE5FI_14560 [Anaerolineales bacterium]